MEASTLDCMLGREYLYWDPWAVLAGNLLWCSPGLRLSWKLHSVKRPGRWLTLHGTEMGVDSAREIVAREGWHCHGRKY